MRTERTRWFQLLSAVVVGSVGIGDVGGVGVVVEVDVGGGVVAVVAVPVDVACFRSSYGCYCCRC